MTQRVNCWLAVLAAAVPRGGRILEIGTGLGVGLGWLIAGIGARTDISVTTVESDGARSAHAQETSWPSWVTFEVGDAVEVLPSLGKFDLIFADAEGGKWYGLDLTIEALALNGTLVLDDLRPQDWKSTEDKDVHLEKVGQIRAQVLAHPDLLSIELDHGAGILLSVRRPRPRDHDPI